MLQHLHSHQNTGHSKIVLSARIGESHWVPGQDYTADDSFVFNRRTRTIESHERNVA